MAYVAHENVLMAITRDCKTVDELLEIFFSFLEYKTDYYHLMLDGEDLLKLSKTYEGSNTHKTILNNNNCGFKINDRERALLKLFRKHQLNYVLKNQPYILEDEELKTKYVPHCDHVISKVDKKKDTSIEKCTEPPSTNLAGTNSTNENHISTWNGAKTEKYFWNQHLNEINLEIPLGNNVKGSEVDVAITNSSIKIQHKGQIKLEGEFYEAVNKEECMWNIEDQKNIIISIEKKRENWWPCVLKGDPEIDTKKIESKKNLNDFDEKTQSELRKFLHEQQLKNKGFQTPEEIRTQELINSAMKAPGSPSFIK